jgi:Zn finger protein HypA/HybF involved in hydrogenase expression
MEGMKDGKHIREWVSVTKKCHDCGTFLEMYEWGDYGVCPKCKIIWSMFRKGKK